MPALVERHHSTSLSRNGRIHDSFVLLLGCILARSYVTHSLANSRHASSRFFTVLPVDSSLKYKLRINKTTYHRNLVDLLVAREVSLRTNFCWVVNQSTHLESINRLYSVVFIVSTLLRSHVHSWCQEP